MRPLPRILQRSLPWIAASFALAVLPATRASAPTAPNIVYILADDLGYGDLGCYGQTKIHTPHIDKLAAEGMRFTQHYSGCTVCAPARSSLLTGLHTGHTPIRGNREVFPEGQHPMPGDTLTVAKLLKAAGYRTAAFGKWGLGFVGTEGDPNKQGFDHFFGYNCQRLAHRYYPPYLWENGRQVFLRGNDTYQKTTYAPDAIHERAKEWLKANRNERFFLFLPYIAPHAELVAPDDEILASYRAKGWKETPFPGVVPGNWGGKANYGDGDWGPAGYCAQPEPRATFAAMVTRLDRQVGEIVRLIDELGLSANTLIFFTSDNGPHREGGADPDFFDSNGPVRGYKRDMTDGGIRVPLIARWKGRVSAGVVNTHVSAFWDMMPTFAELAGALPPTTTDGLSMVPTLLGRAGQKKHEVLYWEFGERPMQAVRIGSWKAIRPIGADGTYAPMQVYDLTKDIGEAKNVAAENPNIVKRAEEVMQRAHRRNPLFLLPGEK